MRPLYKILSVHYVFLFEMEKKNFSPRRRRKISEGAHPLSARNPVSSTFPVAARQWPQSTVYTRRVHEGHCCPTEIAPLEWICKPVCLQCRVRRETYQKCPRMQSTGYSSIIAHEFPTWRLFV